MKSDEVVKRPKHKGIGTRILLGLAGVGVGLGVQVSGALIDKFIYIEILPQYTIGVLGFLFTMLGFGVMGYLVYRWAIK